jgi:hypothetical protein
MQRLAAKHITTMALLVLTAQFSESPKAARVDVLPVDSLRSIVFFDQMDAKVPQIERRLRSMQPIVNPSTAMREAIAGNSALLAKIFQPRWSELQDVASVLEDDRDVLLAKWKRSGGASAIKSVSVWDEPTFNMFLFEVDSTVLNSPDSVRKLWRELFQLDTPPLNITAIDFRLVSVKNSIGIVGMGWVSHHRNPRREDLKGYEISLAAYRSDSQAYLCVWIGKKLVPGVFAPSNVFIPERFPPLNERIKSMSTSALIHEFHDAPERDSVVADELLSRTLTDEEFNQMFYALPGDEATRAYVIFAEIGRLNKTQALQKEIKNLLVKYVQQGESRSGVIAIMLQSLRGTSQIDLSDEVLDLIKKNITVKDSISYLEFRGDTKEIADKLQGLPVPTELERQKQRAVKEIFKRAGAWDRIK